MKILLFVLTLLFSINSSAITGNELHRLLNSEDKDEINYAKHYIVGAVDGINYYKSTEINLAKFQKRKPSLRYFMCPSDIIYKQSIDVIKNYLTQHPENRNESAMDLVATVLFEAWPCLEQ